MKELVKKEIMKWIDVRIIYPILDSKCFSSIQCVPKKGGMTMVANEKNEIIPTFTVTGWRICVDYRTLNKVTRKDHFPLPLLDEMLDILAEEAFYYFFDGYLGYHQNSIAPEDQQNVGIVYSESIMSVISVNS